VRVALALLGAAACLLGMWSAGREGLSRLFASYGSTTNQLEAAERAVALSPSDPEAHYVRASLLADAGELAEAVKEYERAVALRPQDYVLWLELGRARDRANDLDGALTAFKESVRLAPSYARPRWQLGNVLFRAGRREEALAELRRAAAVDRKLLPAAIDLAWAATGGDARAVEQAIQPQTPSMHLALARFFARQGKTSEAVAQYRAAGDVSEQERRVLLEELLAARRFDEAYEVWASTHRENAGAGTSSNGPIINGGFEEAIRLDDPGFGWQLQRGATGVQVSHDALEPRAGTQSLRLVWSGNSDPASPALSQLVLVKPNSRYRLRFAARTEKLVTGALPMITVVDAGGSDVRSLAQPVVLPQGPSAWQDYTTEFKTAGETGAVLVSVRRQDCSSNPCPIFGRIWLDDFSMLKIE
jgi:Flp pilus assembly protein TadD